MEEKKERRAPISADKAFKKGLFRVKAMRLNQGGYTEELITAEDREEAKAIFNVYRRGLGPKYMSKYAEAVSAERVSTISGIYKSERGVEENAEG